MEDALQQNEYQTPYAICTKYPSRYLSPIWMWPSSPICLRKHWPLCRTLQPYQHRTIPPPRCRTRNSQHQPIEGIAPEVWDFLVGGYQVCQKWLKDRKARTLSYKDIEHYEGIVANLAQTIILMQQIDEIIDAGGGWPIG